ncbi:Ycf66 family protein [Synechococcus sp. M16CYN]|uniref:Ycf66 family protein n=1 Tax=Synechococcus sp. M16CYN TaxID=3103139 RepID=UPI003245FD36
MVNASLNWASIVGIVLAIGGALLYFMRSFKPALARDYDVFFAAIGLLCGGILFFQGWRLDPILQFGQFLLAGTTVFFAYESVRLRGVATEQARRSAYFDDEPSVSGGNSIPSKLQAESGWYEETGYFGRPRPAQRSFDSRDTALGNQSEGDFYRSHQTDHNVIPEEAASRRARRRDKGIQDWTTDDERSQRLVRFRAGEANDERKPDFGQRRLNRDSQRRGSSPIGRRERPAGGFIRSDKLDAEDAAFSPSVNSASPQGKNLSLNSVRGRDKTSNSSRPTSNRPISSRSRSKNPSQTASRYSSNGASASGQNSSGEATDSRTPLRSLSSRDNNSRFDD